MSRYSASICDPSWVIRVREVARFFPRQDSHNTVFRALTRRISNRHENGNGFYALKGINLEIAKGEKVAIVGDNGAGKTTLLKLVGGLYRPTVGQIETRGEMVLMRGAEIGMVDDDCKPQPEWLQAVAAQFARTSVISSSSDGLSTR